MSTVWIKFEGWFQCRLATDPDPTDEPRGVSGYARAVAGEPDFDRIIRLQPLGSTHRSHCPHIGVKVSNVLGDHERINQPHPLIGAEVDLLDSPKFEGRNHIVGEDGREAIVPFHILIRKGAFSLKRQFDDQMKFPPISPDDRAKLSQLSATGINFSPGTIGETTGIYNLMSIWEKRSAKLLEDKKHISNEVHIAAIDSRLKSMANRRNTQYFPARMLYRFGLNGTAAMEDPEGLLTKSLPIDAKNPWLVELWCGAWDPDALSGYMQGYVGIPILSGSTADHGTHRMVESLKRSQNERP